MADIGLQVVAVRKNLLEAVVRIGLLALAVVDRIGSPVVVRMVPQQAEGAAVDVVVRMGQLESAARTRADHTAHSAEAVGRRRGSVVVVAVVVPDRTPDTGAGNRQLGPLLRCTQVAHRPQHGEEEVEMISDLCRSWIRSYLIQQLLLLLLRLLVYCLVSCCCGSCTLSSLPYPRPRSLFQHLSGQPSHQT